MVFVPRKKRARPLEAGDRVRVAAHVGGSLDDSGGTFELHGESGRVVGSSYRHPDSGVRMIGVQLSDNGAVAAVPRKALRREG